MFDVIVIGGGAAGFYSAIHIAEARPELQIAIMERGKEVLGKVKVSGGGRCNVTHAEFDPKELTTNYPRGEKELLGPFHTHSSGDTMAFFEERGIPLKIESDGRIFPVSDSSQTIIDCFLNEADRLGIQVFRHSAVTDVRLSSHGNIPKRNGRSQGERRTSPVPRTILPKAGPSRLREIRVRTVWEVTSIKSTYYAKKLVVATGSSPKIWKLSRNWVTI